MKTRYVHDCAKCKFVVQHEDYDVYVHDGKGCPYSWKKSLGGIWVIRRNAGDFLSRDSWSIDYSMPKPFDIYWYPVIEMALKAFERARDPSISPNAR